MGLVGSLIWGLFAHDLGGGLIVFGFEFGWWWVFWVGVLVRHFVFGYITNFSLFWDWCFGLWVCWVGWLFIWFVVLSLLIGVFCFGFGLGGCL